MQEFKRIAISLAAAFALALAAWVYAKLMLRSLRNEDEEAQLGKDRLKRLRPRWLSIVSYAVALLAMSIPLFTPISTLSSSWIVFTALTVIGIAATVHYTRLLRTEADDSPINSKGSRNSGLSGNAAWPRHSDTLSHDPGTPPIFDIDISSLTLLPSGRGRRRAVRDWLEGASDI